MVNCGISQSESVPPSGLAVWEKDILDSLEFMLVGVGRDYSINIVGGVHL